jgi:predicted RNase H-like HicB family nuclease
VEREFRITVRPEVEIVVGWGETNWGAYAPAFPGAVGIGDTPIEALRSVETSLSLAFDELRREAEGAATPIPGHSRRSAAG